MTLYVLDASAWLRLFLGDGPVSAELLRSAAEVDATRAGYAAPSLILVEAAHALHRKRARAQLTDEEVAAVWVDMRRTPIELLSIEEHVERARELAREESVSVYDALYLSVAEFIGVRLLTVDDALAAAARRRGV